MRYAGRQRWGQGLPSSQEPPELQAGPDGCGRESSRGQAASRRSGACGGRSSGSGPPASAPLAGGALVYTAGGMPNWLGQRAPQRAKSTRWQRAGASRKAGPTFESCQVLQGQARHHLKKCNTLGGHHFGHVSRVCIAMRGGAKARSAIQGQTHEKCVSDGPGATRLGRPLSGAGRSRAHASVGSLQAALGKDCWRWHCYHGCCYFQAFNQARLQTCKAGLLGPPMPKQICSSPRCPSGRGI